MPHLNNWIGTQFLFWDRKLCLLEYSVLAFPYLVSESTRQVRIELDHLTSSLPLKCGSFCVEMINTLCLGHNRKMLLMPNLMSHFLNMCWHHDIINCLSSCWEILLLQEFAENSCWPWTWYVAFVRMISQVTWSICYCNDHRLWNGFDNLPYCHHFDIWVPHNDRAIMWKGKKKWKPTDGHRIHVMIVSWREGCLGSNRIEF